MRRSGGELGRPGVGRVGEVGGGRGWRSAGGEGGEVIKRRSCRVVVVCVCVWCFAPDLESDGVAGVVEVMRDPRGRWVKMISGKQPPATQTH